MFFKVYSSKIYKSNNGINWVLVKDTGIASLNTWCSAEYIDGSILIMGGSALKEKVYRSDDDGLNWYYSTSLPTVTEFATSVVFKGNLYLIGGRSGSSSSLGRVIRTLDKGITWESVGDGFNELGRMPATCIHGDYLYIHGGEYYNGSWTMSGCVWRSFDGVTFEKVQTDPTLYGRRGHTLASDGANLYIIGGFTSAASTSRTNSVLISTDGGVTFSDHGIISPYNASNYYCDKMIKKDNETMIYTYNSSTDGTSGSNTTVVTTTDFSTWTETKTDIGSYYTEGVMFATNYSYPPIEIVADISSLSSLSATIEVLPITLLLSFNAESISTFSSTIDLLPPIEVLYISGFIQSASSIATSLQIVSNIYIQGTITINGVTQQNAKIYVLSDEFNNVYTGYSDVNGFYDISVLATGYYHIFCVYKDIDGNKYSALTQPYVYAGEVV